MMDLSQDIRYALRVLMKKPLYSLVTIAVLALAIGANTTVFSAFNAFFLRPLPYPDGDRLVTVYNAYPNMGLDNAGTSIPDYLDRREQAHSLEDLGIFTFTSRALGAGQAPEQIQVIRASPSLFSVLGIPPALGRVFTEEEATLGNDRVVVLSHDLWSTRFGSRSEVLGSDVRLDGEPFTVVGVMPPAFGFPTRNARAWVPFAFTPEETADDARFNEFSGSVGRLRPGATLDRLNEELAAIVRRNVERLPEITEGVAATGFTGRARFLRDTVVGDLEQMLLILQATVLAVLLIACANVANLQLARTAARRKELAVRSALGAGRGRLAMLVLVETVLLALAGGVGGLLVAHGGVELIRELGLDRAAQGLELVFDASVLGFTAGMAGVSALACGLLPLMAVLREEPAQAMHGGGQRGASSYTSQAFRGSLVVVQIAVSVALLVGAGLLTKSFYQLQSEGAGFDAENVWTAHITLPEARYPDTASVARFLEHALEELRALPGVRVGGYGSVLPFSAGMSQGSNAVDGYTPGPGEPEPHSHQRTISDGYFASLGIPVIRGRDFAAVEPERVAIVDEIMARKYWPDGNVLGQRVRPSIEPPEQWYTVVGVVPAIKEASLAESPDKETIYWHHEQRPARFGAFALRTTLPPEQVTGAANAVLLRIDPDLALFDVMPMQTRVQLSLGPQRTPMVLTVVFAATAFTLAVVGIYAVLSWAVTQRFGEIGVRVALGAQAADIVRMVVGQGARLIAVGLAFGLIIAVGLGRLLSSQIHEVSGTDPVVFTVAVAGLTTAALLASWLPARRAARIDPVQSLRQE